MGMSVFRPVGSTTPRVADAGPPAVASPVGPDFRAQMSKVSERSLSRGHADRFDAVVWANDPARAAWPGEGAMPDGAVLVEEAIERTPKGDRDAGVLVMEKHGAAWRFVVVDGGWHVVTWTREAACAACHANAPHDSVFRVEGTPVVATPVDAGVTP